MESEVLLASSCDRHCFVSLGDFAPWRRNGTQHSAHSVLYTSPMAIYEYFCPTCREKFEERRPMSQANVATKCRSGHKAERTISMFAMSVPGGSGGFDDFEMPSGGGCCGGAGGCACSN